MATAIHCFEAAGLGAAPYAFVGIETARDRAAVQTERKSAGMTYTTNYSTSCDYCGTGIKNAYFLRSADGRKFKVGCDCIRKSGDKGLARIVSDEEKRKRQAASDARRMAAVERERMLVEAFRAGRCEALKSQPHPTGRDGSAWDYVEWCVANRMIGARVLRLIESSL